MYGDAALFEMCLQILPLRQSTSALGASAPERGNSPSVRCVISGSQVEEDDSSTR